MLLNAGANQSLTTTAVPVGVNILNAATSPDGKKLFVVSGGHRAQLGDDQPSEWPSITVIASGAEPARYDLTNITDPLAGLAIDPAGRWVVLYPASGTNQPFVENPNELVILDVSQPPDQAVAVPHTLMSFGGHPQRFTFTPPLALPIGSHPLLVVESDQDLSLLNLDDLSKPRRSPCRSPTGPTRSCSRPPASPSIRATRRRAPASACASPTTTTSWRLQFVPSVDASGNSIGNGFLPTVNLNDVGGIANDIAFVHTDSGLRLAALIPSKSKATLIDPVTSLTQDVALPAPYQSLSVVTDALGSASGCDGGTTSAGVRPTSRCSGTGPPCRGKRGSPSGSWGRPAVSPTAASTPSASPTSSPRCSTSRRPMRRSRSCRRETPTRSTS